MPPPLRPNYHQKKWLKYKHKLKQRQMLLQLHKLLFKPQTQQLQENYLLLKRHKLKLKLKLRLLNKQELQLVMQQHKRKLPHRQP